VAGSKVIPIIQQGDQAVRDDVYAALVAAARLTDNQIVALNQRVDKLAETLQQLTDERRGATPTTNG